MRRRRLHRRERKLRNKKIIIASICLICIMSVGFAAFQTNLSLKATGNIKEMTAAKFLKTLVTTSGNGLYKDAYEDNRYIYKGAAPNNYIEFNNEVWRIISVENDNTIKIIRNDGIGKMAWDSSNNDDWTTASLNTYLNGDYYNSLLDTSNIVSHTWNVGEINYSSSRTLVEDISQEKATTWIGKVGLLNVVDYVKTSTNSKCLSVYYYAKINDDDCYSCYSTSLEDNYLTFNNTYYWLMNRATRVKDASFMTVTWTPNGRLSNSDSNDSERFTVRPVLYLSSDIKLTGTGQEKDMYKITD